MKILHILRRPLNAFSREVMARQSLEHEVTVVLARDGPCLLEELPCRTVTLAGGRCENPAAASIEAIGYGDLLDLVFQHDKVFCW